MTIKDIAKEAGYGVGTVSRVLNHNPSVSPQARQRILEVIEKYHFQPNTNARRLKGQTTQGIAMIIKGTHNMLFAQVLEQLQAQCSAAGFSSMVNYIDEADNEVEQAARICAEHRPYGVIFLGSHRENFTPALTKLGVPCLLMTNSAADCSIENLSSISVDDRSAAARMTQYLCDQGHREIELIGGFLDTSQPSAARLSGCLSVFSQQGIPYDAASRYVASRYTLEGGYRAMEQLLEARPHLTAVFAFSDIMAIGAIRALGDHGLRVPQDVSVCGFDGLELSQYLIPRLTTIRQPTQKMASRGMDILLRTIREGAESVHQLIPYELVEGESVGAL